MCASGVRHAADGRGRENSVGGAWIQQDSRHLRSVPFVFWYHEQYQMQHLYYKGIMYIGNSLHFSIVTVISINFHHGQ